MEAPAIEINGLSHSYGKRMALANLDLIVPSNSIFALVGPNGSGKSTLFRILSTLVPVRTGTVSILGHDLSREAPAIRRRIGVLFQSPALDRKLTVAENLRCGGYLYGLRGSELNRRVRLRAGELGVEDRLRDPVETLSGGLQRRVEIAKALLPDPELLLLDEPSAGLDPGAVAACREIFRGLRQQGIAILLTTHSMDEAARADRVAILHRGSPVAEGPPAELCAGMGDNIVVVRCTDSAAIRQEIEAIPGHGKPRVIDEEIHVASANPHELAGRLHARFGAAILSITVAQPTLDEVFAQKTGCSMARAEETFARQ